MAKDVVGRCPACGEGLEVTRLECPACGTGVDGRFQLCGFCRLRPEQREFVELFLVARGNLRELERVLGISYPTVRSRLEGILEALGHRVTPQEEEPGRRREILQSLSRGEISVPEAIRLLRE